MGFAVPYHMHVFCVHGFLAPKAILWPIARQLNRAGYTSTLFGYPSHRGTLQDHAHSLAETVDKSGQETFGFVGHSMGGLVIRAALASLRIPPQRMVFISTPHRGCQLMRSVRKGPFAALVSQAARRTGYGLDSQLPLDICGTIVGRRDRTVRPEEGVLRVLRSWSYPTHTTNSYFVQEPHEPSLTFLIRVDSRMTGI